jgi:large subunit ribosomal protein L16
MKKKKPITNRTKFFLAQKNFYRKKNERITFKLPKLKYKRSFQKLIRGKTTSLDKSILQNGYIGIQALQSGYLKFKHYYMIKQIMIPVTKNRNFFDLSANLWVRFFTDHQMTTKPQQSRMGRGKGSPSIWYSKIYAGQLIIEVRKIRGRNRTSRMETALLNVSKKLPLVNRIIKRIESSKKILNRNILYYQINRHIKKDIKRKDRRGMIRKPSLQLHYIR